VLPTDGTDGGKNKLFLLLGNGNGGGTFRITEELTGNLKATAKFDDRKKQKSLYQDMNLATNDD
jgi:hypothetical protein